MGAYGGMFSRWLQSESHLPQSSFGNGSAMRVAPVAWLFGSHEEVLCQAKLSAEVSHCHAEGVKGAQCVASLIYRLRTGGLAREDIGPSVREEFGYDIPPMEDILKIGAQGHFDATCQETVPYAIRCLVDSTSFEDAIRLAVMADGDTDTKAAICGSMAEAMYEIPYDMAEKAMALLPKDMLAVVERFYGEVERKM